MPRSNDIKNNEIMPKSHVMHFAREHVQYSAIESYNEQLFIESYIISKRHVMAMGETHDRGITRNAL